jgi:N-acetylneuraminate synthase
MKIGGKDISEETFVIAEAGSNHNGSLKTAKELIDVAADAGADAVKFQTFRAKDMYVRDTGDSGEIDGEQSLYAIMESMEMPYEWIPELQDYCQQAGVVFLSTPFDERSAEKLDEYVPAYKIASFTLSHHPFLREIASKDKPVIMSTGAHELNEIREAVEVLQEAGADELVLLHCVSSYPTPLESINVRAVETLDEEFSVPVGFSDHTTDPTTAPSAAVALGASVVEKHYTLNKSMDGPDHSFALEPDELEAMVSAIRNTETALDDGTIGVQEAETELQEIARRRLHAGRDISTGERITDEDVEILRSGNRKQGLEPKHYEAVLGRKAATDIATGEGITWDDIKGQRPE